MISVTKCIFKNKKRLWLIVCKFKSSFITSLSKRWPRLIDGDRLYFFYADEMSVTLSIEILLINNIIGKSMEHFLEVKITLFVYTFLDIVSLDLRRGESKV